MSVSANERVSIWPRPLTLRITAAPRRTPPSRAGCAVPWRRRARPAGRLPLSAATARRRRTRRHASTAGCPRPRATRPSDAGLRGAGAPADSASREREPGLGVLLGLEPPERERQGDKRRDVHAGVLSVPRPGIAERTFSSTLQRVSEVLGVEMA